MISLTVPLTEDVKKVWPRRPRPPSLSPESEPRACCRPQACISSLRLKSNYNRVSATRRVGVADSRTQEAVPFPHTRDQCGPRSNDVSPTPAHGSSQGDPTSALQGWPSHGARPL